MNTTFILRNKQFNKLTEIKKQEAISQVRKAYLEDNMKIDELISTFNSTKTFMYDFLRKNNIKKSKEQLNAERSISTKQSYANKSKKEIEDIKEKRKQTNLKRFGVENCYQSEEVKQKIKKDCLEKYGVEYHTQRKDTKKKIDDSTIKSQGAKRYLQTEKGLEKYKETCLEKYGVENTFQSEDKKQKIKETNLERYGDEIPCRTEDIKNKMKEHSLDKWGTEYPVQSLDVRNKIKTSFSKHSDEDKQEINNKRKQTNLKKYGTENYVNKEKIKESLNNRTYEEKQKTKQLVKEKWLSKSKIDKDIILEKRKQTNQNKYGVPWSCMREECRSQSGSISKINQHFANILSTNNIDFEQEFVLENYSYDFKVNDILIEIDPSYTHNSTISAIFSNSKSKKEPLSKFYHQNKSKVAEKAGFRCIHIFDWDNIDKIINILLPKSNIYARNCEIKEVEKSETDEFLNLYHLQNTCKGQLICYGLYYNNQLVEIMTFGKPRYNKNYEWELLRLCSHKDYNVIGGSERLFKHFLSIIKPSNIVSYCDVAKFSGEVYERLGMELFNTSGPACIWSKGKTRITDNLLRQQGFDRLFKTNYGKGTSNKELILNEGFVEVYDCGQKSFRYINKSI